MQHEKFTYKSRCGMDEIPFCPFSNPQNKIAYWQKLSFLIIGERTCVIREKRVNSRKGHGRKVFIYVSDVIETFPLECGEIAYEKCRVGLLSAPCLATWRPCAGAFHPYDNSPVGNVYNRLSRKNVSELFII